MDSDEILIELHASTARRYMGVGMLGALGLILLWLALTQSPGFAGQVMLIGTGAGALWMAQTMWQATQHRLTLTDTDLRTSDGQILARLDQISRVDRGFLAFKPSNGFSLTLQDKAPLLWQPGLYWRFGRKLGVGGVTSAAQGRAMADLIAAQIRERA